MMRYEFDTWELVKNKCLCGGNIIVAHRLNRAMIVECDKCGKYMLIKEPIEHFLARG